MGSIFRNCFSVASILFLRLVLNFRALIVAAYGTAVPRRTRRAGPRRLPFGGADAFLHRRAALPTAPVGRLPAPIGRSAGALRALLSLETPLSRPCRLRGHGGACLLFSVRQAACGPAPQRAPPAADQTQPDHAVYWSAILEDLGHRLSAKGCPHSTMFFYRFHDIETDRLQQTIDSN